MVLRSFWPRDEIPTTRECPTGYDASTPRTQSAVRFWAETLGWRSSKALGTRGKPSKALAWLPGAISAWETSCGLRSASCGPNTHDFGAVGGADGPTIDDYVPSDRGAPHARARRPAGRSRSRSQARARSRSLARARARTRARCACACAPAVES